MRMQPVRFGAEQFNVARVIETDVSSHEGDIMFEIELRLRGVNQNLFAGFVQSHWFSGGHAEAVPGIGMSIDPASGEVKDLLNEQGIVGYFDASPFECGETIFFCLSVEKIGNVFLPKLTVGEETLLYPALHLEAGSMMSFVVGTTSKGRDATFENPHLQLTRSPRVSA
ncbi:MAG: hypothetical protein AAGJ79_08400 [Verrucomicrobiota bacterium]